ncbi:MAG: sigma-54 dependent transcriptional regulator [Rhodanobacteraceae bacterium]
MSESSNGHEHTRILLIDDEPGIVRTFRYCLEDAGYHVSTAPDAERAEQLVQTDVFDVCFLDHGLGATNGLDLLPVLHQHAPWLKVVMVTANSSIDTAVDAMRVGAVDYLVKPCSPDQLRLAAAKQIQARRLEQRIELLEQEHAPSLPLESASPTMRRILETARQVAATDAGVLLTGESGTGKGVLARAIHGLSQRAQAPFVTVNCPSLSAELLESELFGHKRGAFTGATENRLGRVDLAQGGTVFLDEVGDVPMALQSKLLRFIQDREYERVGDPVTRRCDVRIVAATNHDLPAMVEAGRFREDLLYRLNVICLELPPLRERPEDIERLAEYFLARCVAAYRRPARNFSVAGRGALLAYPWPGNVRELANVVERASILCNGTDVEPTHLSIVRNGNERRAVPRIGDPLSLAEIEKAHIAGVMSGSATLDSAARTLGIDASTLYRKRKQYQL